MSRWRKEPLIHFLLIGGLVFAVYDHLAGKGSAPAAFWTILRVAGFT